MVLEYFELSDTDPDGSFACILSWHVLLLPEVENPKLKDLLSAIFFPQFVRFI